MDDQIQVIVPAGMFGANEFDSALDKFLRELAVKADTEPEAETRWAEKYGADVETEVFMMHPFCWCDSEECAWCIHGDHPTFLKVLGEKFGNEDKSEPYIYQRHSERRYWDAPNFWFKPLDFRVTWYKYIGRDTATNKDLTPQEFSEMWQACLGADSWAEEIG